MMKRNERLISNEQWFSVQAHSIYEAGKLSHSIIQTFNLDSHDLQTFSKFGLPTERWNFLRFCTFTIPKLYEVMEDRQTQMAIEKRLLITVLTTT